METGKNLTIEIETGKILENKVETGKNLTIEIETGKILENKVETGKIIFDKWKNMKLKSCATSR